MVGPHVDLTYPYEFLGDGPAALEQLNKGGKFAEKLAKASHPAVIVGPGILRRQDRNAILQQASALPGLCNLLGERLGSGAVGPTVVGASGTGTSQAKAQLSCYLGGGGGSRGFRVAESLCFQSFH